MGQPQLSIIVPVYREPELLARCLCALAGQKTDREYEVILCVAHDADPKVREIALAFSAANPLFRIIDVKPENAARGETRLEGVLAAKAPLITFCDSDDYYEENGVEDILDVASATNADIVCFAFDQIYAKKTKPYRPRFHREKILSKRRAHRRLVRDCTIPYFVWNKVFKRQLFDTSLIRFKNRAALFEDCAMTYSLFLAAETIALSRRSYYCYDKASPSSVTHEKRTDRARCHLALYAAERFYLDTMPDKNKLLSAWRAAGWRMISMLIFDSHIDRKNGKSEFFHLLHEFNGLWLKKMPSEEGKSYSDLIGSCFEEPIRKSS